MRSAARSYLERGGAAPGRVAVTTEMFDAVLAARPPWPLDFDARLKARAPSSTCPSRDFTAANKRIANILRKARAAGGISIEHPREGAEVVVR
jgi:hypothetical protein